jgi:hypothetical protein
MIFAAAKGFGKSAWYEFFSLFQYVNKSVRLTPNVEGADLFGSGRNVAGNRPGMENTSLPALDRAHPRLREYRSPRMSHDVANCQRYEDRHDEK